MDHEGGGAVKFQRWNGEKWEIVSDWIPSDQSIVRPEVEKSAAKYAAEKGITLRNCTQEATARK
jgi:branched-chain amino acid transport system substrate-binding protein